MAAEHLGHLCPSSSRDAKADLDASYCCYRNNADPLNLISSVVRRRAEGAQETVAAPVRAIDLMKTS